MLSRTGVLEVVLVGISGALDLGWTANGGVVAYSWVICGQVTQHSLSNKMLMINGVAMRSWMDRHRNSDSTSHEDGRLWQPVALKRH